MKISAPLKYGCLVPLALVALLFIGGCIYDKLAPSKARSALPPTASDVQEFYREVGFDFSRCLKAKLPRVDFDTYARNLELTKDYTPGMMTSDPVKIQISGHFPGWFDAPGVDEASAVKYSNGGAWVAVLQYKEPYVYFFIFDW